MCKANMKRSRKRWGSAGPFPAAPQMTEPDKEKAEQKARDDFTRKWRKQKEMLSDLLKFLLDKGVSTLAADKVAIQ